MHRFPHAIVSLTALLVFFAAPTNAAVTPAQRCTAVKLDAAARATVAHVACHAKAIQKGAAVNLACHAGADRRLDTAFARIEARGGCPFVGDVGAVDTAIDELVDALVAGATTGRCGATKLRAAARKAYNELACHRVAVRHGDEPAPACQNNAFTRFLDAFARAEKRFACGTTGDAPAVQALVDDFVADTAARLIDGAVPGGAPANLTAVIAGSEVQLQWTAPLAGSGSTHVRVLRRLDVAPIDAADPLATVVFFGTASVATDALTALLPTTATIARTYHYAAFGCTAGGICESVGSRTTLAPTLLQVLKGGGYTIYFRHASATVCVDQTSLGTAATTSVPDWWKSCDANCGTTATARQLDATGVTQATTIGQGFDTVAIPANRVISSEFCRTLTTAQLMDLGPTIETNQGITFFVYDEAGRCAAAKALLAEVPAAGGNTAIIGHAGFTCDEIGTLAMGEGAIFKPDGAGGSLFIARQQPSTWAGLQ